MFLLCCLVSRNVNHFWLVYLGLTHLVDQAKLDKLGASGVRNKRDIYTRKCFFNLLLHAT
jgi:hypothetical protein